MTSLGVKSNRTRRIIQLPYPISYIFFGIENRTDVKTNTEYVGLYRKWTWYGNRAATDRKRTNIIGQMQEKQPHLNMTNANKGFCLLSQVQTNCNQDQWLDQQSRKSLYIQSGESYPSNMRSTVTLLEPSLQFGVICSTMAWVISVWLYMISLDICFSEQIRVLVVKIDNITATTEYMTTKSWDAESTSTGHIKFSIVNQYCNSLQCTLQIQQP